MNELQAGEFYTEHRGRGFYPELVSYMASGPVLAMELVRYITMPYLNSDNNINLPISNSTTQV